MASLSIIIPVKNEEGNIRMLLDKISNVPSKEVIIVDDGNDRTTEIAKSFNAKVIKGRSLGLGQAIIDGINASDSDIVLIMDGDLSHNPDDILRLIAPIEKNGADMTIGSRYIKGGDTKNWSFSRLFISRTVSFITSLVTGIKDSTSGFFAFRKSIYNNKIKAHSWKIMLEVLIKCNPDKVVEVPITFNERYSGKSKAKLSTGIIYFKHLLYLTLYKFRSLIKFGIVGGTVALIHFSILYVLTDIIGFWYIISTILSIIIAATIAYILHHKWTFLGKKISNHAMSWGKYQVVSGISDGIYLGLLVFLTEIIGIWYLASAVLAAIVIFPIKYIAASVLIWNEKKRNPNSSNYDWESFYRGNPIQKWWKQSIAKTVWKWIPNNSKLLDIGCGSSPIIVKYDKAIGIDINQDKLDFISKKLPEALFENKSTKEFSDEYFDYVLCIEVLEHLENPKQMLQEISRILKPGGRTVLATPDYGRKHWLLAEKFTPAGEQHISQFTRKSLKTECKKVGLIPLKHKYVAGCDLIEMFAKPYENENGSFPDSKMKLVKTGITVMSKWVKPVISRANFAITYKCNHQCKTCNIWQTYRKNPQNRMSARRGSIYLPKVTLVQNSIGIIAWMSIAAIQTAKITSTTKAIASLTSFSTLFFCALLASWRKYSILELCCG